MRSELPELGDQIVIATFRFGPVLLEFFEQLFTAVERGEDERYRRRRDRCAGPKFSHQGFGRVRQRLQPRESKKAAGAFDGMNKPKNIVEHARVIGLLLEAHELGIPPLETLICLDDEVAKQIIHNKGGSGGACKRCCSTLHFVWRTFNFSCG